MQIQTIEYGLNDTIRMKNKKKLYRYFTHLHTHSDMKFQSILVPKVILKKSIVTKRAGPLEPFLSLVSFELRKIIKYVLHSMYRVGM